MRIGNTFPFRPLLLGLIISLTENASEKVSEQFIKKYGYPAESHYVKTSDGYIVTLHRIPVRTQSKPNDKARVVYLTHGLWGCSMQWLFAGPEKSLAFILADQGYDVWLGNDRGNEYSRNHTYLDPDKDSTFWDFSWHEIGIYDLPASIDYILDPSNQTKLYYIGHSEGTTTMYVLLSMLPVFNRKIAGYIHLAPAVFMGHLKSLAFTIPAAFLNMFRGIAPLFESSEVFLIRDGTKIGSHICSKSPMREFCSIAYFSISGPSKGETDTTLLPDLMRLVPGGGSFKQFFHYLQEVTSGRFRQYDYGSLKNVLYYGQTTPPDYNLSKVTAPGYIIYAENDYISDSVIDVPTLCNSIGNCLQKILVPVENFGHVDFLIGKSAPNVVYFKIIELLSQLYVN